MKTARMSHGSPWRMSSAIGRPRWARGFRVRLRRDLPEHGIKGGDCGTVVHVFEGAKAYLVEFVSPTDGSSRALAELTPDQLGPVAEA
jgi:uncharacterized protein DUF4926